MAELPGLSKFDEAANKMMTKLVAKFDITGEGTILSAGGSSAAASTPSCSAQSAPSTPVRAPAAHGQ